MIDTIHTMLRRAEIERKALEAQSIEGTSREAMIVLLQRMTNNERIKTLDWLLNNPEAVTLQDTIKCFNDRIEQHRADLHNHNYQFGHEIFASVEQAKGLIKAVETAITGGALEEDK